MTDWVNWARKSLQTSAEEFEWAFSKVDPAYHQSIPPDTGLGLWPPARHMWHVTEYERCLAIPIMKQWLGAPPLSDDDDIWPDSDEMWAEAAHQPAEAYIKAFWDARHEQLAMFDALEAVDWSALRPTGWGEKPLSMVVTKTYQHTWEHGNTLMRMGLWWKDIVDGNW